MSSIINLNERDFSFSINNKPRVVNRNTNGKYGLICVKAEWCSFCQRAKPEFKASADMLSGNNLFFAMIDVDKNQSLVEKLGVNSFPTFLFVDKSGFIADIYKGERSKYGFNQYICVKTRQCRV